MQGLTWTRISATVPAGATSIPLQEAVQWKAGDTILLVTTTWKGARLLSPLARLPEVAPVAPATAHSCKAPAPAADALLHRPAYALPPVLPRVRQTSF